MKHYLVWTLLSIGLHGGLFWAWSPDLQPVELPLQAGQKAVSLRLIDSAPSLRQPEPKTTTEPGSSAEPKAIAEPDLVNSGSGEVEAKSADITKPNRIISAPSPSIAEPTRTSERKRAEKVSEIKKELDREPQKQPPVSAAQMSASQSAGVLTQARPQSSQRPKYPNPAIIRNQQGKVIVRLLVDRNGKVQTTELLKTSGYRMLDMSVLRFVEQEQFVAATQNGKAIDSTQVFAFKFVLDERPE